VRGRVFAGFDLLWQPGRPASLVLGGVAADALGVRWLLVRRNRGSGELAFYVCAGPAGLPLIALVRVAGTRWRVE
jgi:hypothetical protein